MGVHRKTSRDPDDKMGFKEQDQISLTLENLRWATVDTLACSCVYRLIGQCAAEPWRAVVWSELLNIASESCERYLQSFLSLQGCSYRDARRSVPAATVIGYHSVSQGRVRMNPPETDLVKVGSLSLGIYWIFEPCDPRGALSINT